MSTQQEAVGRIEARTAKVVVVGQGYVGLPVAMRAVEVGFPVIGYDASVQRVASLQAGDSYVGDVSDDQLRAALEADSRAPTLIHESREVAR